MKRIVPAVCLLAAIGLAGCMDTNQDVIDQHASGYKDLRQLLADIAASLPPSGSVRGDQPCESLDPPLTLKPGFEECNAEVLMVEQLADPDSKPKLDVGKSGWMLDALRWTGPRNPMGEMERDYFTKDEFRRKIAAPLSYRYLIVYRTVTVDLPTFEKFANTLDVAQPGIGSLATDRADKQVGTAVLECFVIDLRTKQVLGSQRLEAHTPKDLATTHERYDNETREQFNEYVTNLLMMDVDTQLAPRLRQIAEGEVSLKPRR